MPTRQAVFTVFGIATIATLCVLPNLMQDTKTSTGVDSYFEEARSFQRRFLDDDDSNCTHHHNTCEQVRANCQLGTGGTALFNYYEFYYCTTSSSKWIGFTVLILWLLIVFSLLASTADSFFVVQLETMSEKLRLSPTVAGITLCAVGNSAPDVFSDLAAVQNANDFSLALGELMGASMFLTTCVLGAVILVATSKDNDHANVNGVDFVRDVTIFSIALGLLLIFTLTEQKIYLYESLMIIGVYLLYIAVVVSMSYWKTPSTDLHHMNTMPPDVGLMKNKNNNETKRNTQTNTTLTDSLLEAGENIDESNEEDEDDDSRMYGLDWSSEDSVFEKLTFVVEFPFSVMRWLSIASANTSHWDWRRRYLACFAPIGTVIVVFLDFSGNWQSGTSWDGFREPKIAGHVPVVYIFILAAALIGVLIFMTTNNTEIPSYHWALVLLAFISTVAWLDMIGNECVAVLEALGTITSITSTSEGHSIMGITVLAWANSIGDFVADTAIARSGKVKMAIASTFGSPLLTACLGLGLATVVAASSNSNHSVQSKMDGELWISYIFLALSMGSSLTLISSKGFRVPRWYAFYLFGLYSMYVLFSVLHCTKVI